MTTDIKDAIVDEEPSENRSYVLNTHWNPEEKKALEELARQFGSSKNVAIRMAVLGALRKLKSEGLAKP